MEKLCPAHYIMEYLPEDSYVLSKQAKKVGLDIVPLQHKKDEFVFILGDIEKIKSQRQVEEILAKTIHYIVAGKKHVYAYLYLKERWMDIFAVLIVLSFATGGMLSSVINIMNGNNLLINIIKFAILLGVFSFAFYMGKELHKNFISLYNRKITDETKKYASSVIKSICK